MRTRRAQRVLEAAGVLRQVPRPQAQQQPNRIAYWVAAQVLLPSGSLALVTDEIVVDRPIAAGAQLRRIEAMLAEGFKAQTAGGVPVVGGRAPEAHVMSFTALRAWYEPSAELAPSASAEEPGA